MALIPASVRRDLRRLSLGPDQEWGFWGWTFHDGGSTWAAVAFDTESGVIGWAGLTRQADVLPVVGCYVDPRHRGDELATGLVTRLLACLLATGELDDVGAVFASTERWPGYADVLEGLGLRCLTWQ
jgi:RimJ/RimL family protein N-acetyltransferase